MKRLSLSFSLILLLVYSCSKNEELSLCNPDIKWWILVHPSYGNSGIYLYNETKSVIEKRIDLPDSGGSPHALDFDGTSLWVGGMASTINNDGRIIANPIYQLDPADGFVISKIENIATEGIVCSSDYIYYTSNGKISKMRKDGVLIDEKYLVLSTSYIQDLAIKDSTFYFVRNGVYDPIVKVEKSGLESELVSDTGVNGLYTLSVDGDRLVVVTDDHRLRRFDINTGEFVSDIKIHIDGWITAIALHSD